MSEILKITDDGQVRTIRLNRPEVKNALNLELGWGIVAAVQEAAKDDSVWIIAITGTGDSFCSGLDLRGAGDYSPLSPQERYLDDLGWISQFPLVMRQECEKPIVAGINGVAVGGGLSLAMAADIRIMSRNARILAGYPRIGGSPDGGMTFTLSQAIGYEKTMRFLLENRTVNGQEAYDLGIVGEVVDDDKFDARLSEYCQQLAQVSPITGRLTKRTVGKATTAIDLEAQLRLEISSIGRAFGSNDGKEARQAFMEKRAPVFEGR
jgi:2-(1,2-epoxy-1,2-dihydrophenyl)acetyl-CoA isomerase